MLYLLAYLLLEPLKRVASAVVYPLAYAVRRRLRAAPALNDLLYHTDFWPLWLFLDDSIHMEQGREYDDKAKRYPAVMWRWHNDFLLSYWWSAIRNSCVNWNNYSAYRLGDFISEGHRANLRRFYITRTFTNGKRPYCEFWLFGRWNQVGWISCGRFEIDVMKRRV